MPFQSITRLSAVEKQKLSRLVLEYFREANFVKNMDKEPEFAEFNPDDVKHVRLSLWNIGLITKANFASGNGVAYVITSDGIMLLEGEMYGTR